MHAWVLFRKVSFVRGSKAVAPHKNHTTAARSPRRVSGDTLNTDTGIDTRNPTHHEILKSYSFLRIYKKGKVEADHSIQLMWWEAQWNFKTVFAAKRKKKKKPRLAEASSTLSKVLHVFRSSQTSSQTHELSGLLWPERRATRGTERLLRSAGEEPITSVVWSTFPESEAAFVLFSAFCNVHTEWPVTQELTRENTVSTGRKKIQWPPPQRKPEYTYCTIVCQGFLKGIHFIKFYIAESWKRKQTLTSSRNSRLEIQRDSVCTTSLHHNYHFCCLDGHRRLETKSAYFSF